MKICLLTQCGLNRAHGTGSQLVSVYADGGLDFGHFYIQPGDHGRSTVGDSYLLKNNRLPIPCRRMLGLSWRQGPQNDEANQRRFARLLRRRGWKFDVAHVVIAHESHAKFFAPILRQLNVPYVAHLMDLYYDSELDAAAMPAMKNLLHDAAEIVTLTGAMDRELRKFGVTQTSRIYVGQDSTVPQASAPESGGAVRIALIGRPYQGGAELLSRAMGKLEKGSSIEIVYAGAYRHLLPQPLQQLVKDAGFIADREQYGKLLASCHLGLLTGPAEMDRFGRYSFPSRCTDLLMAGLPVLACVPGESATADVLRPIIPGAVKLVADETAMVDAVQAFTSSSQMWNSASQSARSFAVQNFAMEHVRRQTVDVLKRATETRRVTIHDENDVMVSAVIPTFNRRDVIERAIDSILSQTVRPDEIVLMDDGSTDGTAELVQSRYRNVVRVVRQPNGGVSAARARCVAEARGKWIAFLDSDDQWTADHLEKLLGVAKQVPEDVAWIFGDMMTVADGGQTQTIFNEHGLKLSADPEVFDDPLVVQYPFQFGFFQSSLIRRDVLLELNCFREGFRSNDDLLVGFQVACRYRYAATSAVVALLDRTTELRKNSVELTGRFSAEHYRSRMMAFALAVQTGRPGPWRQIHADAVRGLCLKMAMEGRGGIRRLALRQLRYGVSAKAVAFCGVAMLGRSSATLWNRAKSFAPPAANGS